jgi:hypothetical protein
MATQDLEGIQFPLTADDQRSSTRTGKTILSAALDAINSPAAQAVRDEPQWRQHYPKHLCALTEAGIRDAEHALTSAAAGLAAAWQQFEFVRGGATLPLAEAMQQPRPDRFHAIHLHGQGSPEIEPWTLPYRGKRLSGAELDDRLGRWEHAGIIEPSHAQALRQIIAHPEWLDLSDRTLVLLGAASEAGPLATLARWRATIVAVDLPHPAVWHKIVQTVTQGNAHLIAPLSQSVAADTPPDQWIALAGANLLTDTPELIAWLSSLESSLDIAALAYLDGERHVRVSMAMDAIMTGVSAAKSDTTLMYMATPTDVFAVPEDAARMAMRRYVERTRITKAAAATLQRLSGGRFLQPHITGLIQSGNGKQYGVVDCIVTEQGPNYALAKRLQQWRAVVARASGQRVSLNVAPSTTTRSVIKNRALKAGFAGASLFGIEAFAPETTNALIAALWVHDLRCTGCAADPSYRLDHPLELLMAGANHGGLWRMGYLPRSALPLAAIVGSVRSIP